ncbi:DUF1349 domain-containing protein [Streptomyces sp. NPDC008121]|uniref:DUF1349 domain-containing protein n=1 Tax=Streptomyces sp. NPDC008121 TaxID=3364809 RepID=UPI0036EEA815
MIDSPAPFPGATWAVAPASWSVSDGTLTVTAAARTDVFADPLTGASTRDAARALAVPPDGDWQFSARVRVGFRASWDAGALIVWSDDDHWAKLNFEQAPDGTPAVFSVVTRGRSDDAVGVPVDGAALWLRISRLDGGFAFHTSADGTTWRLVRQFALDAPSAPRVGIEVQSPVGEGCQVVFDSVRLTPTRLGHLSDGR